MHRHRARDRQGLPRTARARGVATAGGGAAGSEASPDSNPEPKPNPDPKPNLDPRPKPSSYPNSKVGCIALGLLLAMWCLDDEVWSRVAEAHGLTLDYAAQVAELSH